ncbi:ABC transporter substrate-binding protein [Agrobacterium sp. NPDC089420]|uniref:ABC transporter substrate-binding protein n=1 Tax=Agrobacterium sp. NPDC089420 TaxID=3363918 RepID=UPI00384F3798
MARRLGICGITTGAVALSMAMPCLALEFREAPMLAEQVAAGTLPPLSERLPENPEVVTPFERIGAYGGQMQFGMVGPDNQSIEFWTGQQNLVRYDPSTDYATVVPNLAESWDVDVEGKVYTFHLRRGVKWSDGTTFTANDIEFSMNDLLLNPKWVATPRVYFSGGKPVKFTKIDDFTVEFSFAEPFGFFPEWLADRTFSGVAFYQKAYCSQFHPDYARNIADQLKAANLTDWRDLLQMKCGSPPTTYTNRFANPKRPTLDPWIITSGLVGGATQVELVRNPYFWQVDSEGNQLPYVDRLVGTIYSDPEALLLGAIAGRIDFGIKNLDANANRPALAVNAEKGGYVLHEVTSNGGAGYVFQLNLTHKDPELRELFNKKDFRVALSVALDRQSIIDTALLGDGFITNEPFQHSPYYHERYAGQFLAYDPAQANALLDSLGYTKRNDAGIRLLNTGRAIRFNIDVPATPPTIGDILEIAVQQWAAVGVKVDITVPEQSLMFSRINANDHDAALWEGSMLAGVPARIPVGMVPISTSSWWGVAWVNWYLSGGKDGEEPPENVKQRVALYEKAHHAMTEEARVAIYKEIADIAANQFEIFAITKHSSFYGIRKAALGNILPTTPKTSQYPQSLMLPQTWYWTK